MRSVCALAFRYLLRRFLHFLLLKLALLSIRAIPTLAMHSTSFAPAIALAVFFYTLTFFTFTAYLWFIIHYSLFN